MYKERIMKPTLITLLLMGSLAACSPDFSNEKNKQANHYPSASIGISISSTATNPFFQNMHRIYDEEAKAHAKELKIQLQSADNNQETQNMQLQNMVEQGAKSLIINLADVKQSKEVVDYWCKKNIPVVYFNRKPDERDLASCENAYFLDGDVTQAAVYQGIQVLQKWQQHPQWDKNQDGIIQYAIIMGLPEHDGSIQRTKWAGNTLGTYPQLKRKTQQIFKDFAFFQENKAEELVTQWTQQPEFSQVEVILTNNDTMALGALAALEKQNIKLPIFGIDGSKAALQAIEQGKLAGTVFNDFEGQAKVSLRMAANLAAGKNVMDGLNHFLEHKTVLIQAQDINQDNLKNFLERYP